MAALEQSGKILYRFVLRLFMERDEKQELVISLGRLTFTAVLIQLFVLWHRALFGDESVTMPPGLLEVFWTLAAYVFGTKVVRTGSQALQSRKSQQEGGPPAC